MKREKDLDGDPSKLHRHVTMEIITALEHLPLLRLHHIKRVVLEANRKEDHLCWELVHSKGSTLCFQEKEVLIHTMMMMIVIEFPSCTQCIEIPVSHRHRILNDLTKGVCLYPVVKDISSAILIPTITWIENSTCVKGHCMKKMEGITTIQEVNHPCTITTILRIIVEEEEEESMEISTLCLHMRAAEPCREICICAIP